MIRIILTTLLLVNKKNHVAISFWIRPAQVYVSTNCHIPSSATNTMQGCPRFLGLKAHMLCYLIRIFTATYVRHVLQIKNPGVRSHSAQHCLSYDAGRSGHDSHHLKILNCSSPGE